MGKIVLVTGGARSGKSSWAQQNAENSTAGKKRVFIATAVPIDTEMSDRILKHREDRDAAIWTTVESPYELAKAVASVDNESVVCIDCITVWLGNMWYQLDGDEDALNKCGRTLCNAFQVWKTTMSGEMFIVTNEVGWGIVPESPEVRMFRDTAGFLNKSLAAIADELILTICGVPLKVK
ncbi:MAG TPA: bifunctional adenosylcobinamide kinase/adenosylcobinamide-phosphate guanylyltransferase [Chitinispirillaceae bacterium]|nr:bifunctional adenosylcobinamide kinase/adenosylcobinamide-phosphate guanylyltransferase [Chitinispirillaceae bacterium]